MICKWSLVAERITKGFSRDFIIDTLIYRKIARTRFSVIISPQNNPTNRKHTRAGKSSNITYSGTRVLYTLRGGEMVVQIVWYELNQEWEFEAG